MLSQKKSQAYFRVTPADIAEITPSILQSHDKNHVVEFPMVVPVGPEVGRALGHGESEFFQKPREKPVEL